MGRRAPRPASEALRRFRESVAPLTPLGLAQAHWAEVVGEQVAAASVPVAERRGELVVRCVSSVWAQELNLMAPQILSSLSEATGDKTLEALRFEVGDHRS